MYEELKHRVTLRSGIEISSPGDCKKIADDIFETTRKKISETTLKRLFGFATIKHQFSKYTLATLIEYTETDCSISLHTKINPDKGKIKDHKQIKFDLQDGELDLGTCIPTDALHTDNGSTKKELPIEITLTKKQVKDLVKSISKKTK